MKKFYKNIQFCDISYAEVNQLEEINKLTF